MENAETYPLVTVVIPTFNRAGLLAGAIRSVLEQSWTQLELIVVDDGSTDQTRSVVEAIPDQRLHYIQCAHSGNPAIVRNTGAREARGEWISFLDSDDHWRKDKLEKQMAALVPGGKWCYGNYTHINESNEELKEVHKNFLRLDGMITEQILRNETSVYIGTVILHRETFQQLRGFREDPAIRFREDLDFALRLSLLEQAVAVQEILTEVRIHGNRSTNELDKPFLASSRVYELFSEEKISNKLRRISQARRAYLLSEVAASARYRMGLGKRMNLLKKSFAWDKMSHWLHCFFRTLVIKRN